MRIARAVSGVFAILGVLAAPAVRAAEASKPVALVAGTSGGASAADDVRMKALEAEVDALKEKVFNSKARLLQLQEVTLHGAAAGAIAKIRFKNDMGGAYRLESATWVLDGQTIYSAAIPESRPVASVAGKTAGNGGALLKAPEAVTPSSTLDDRKELALFDGAIIPGSHNLTVTLVYRGSGYQVFTYLEGYRFTVQSSYAFLAEEGKTTELTVTASPKPELMHSYEDRLDLKFALSSKESVLPQPAPESKP